MINLPPDERRLWNEQVAEVRPATYVVKVEPAALSAKLNPVNGSVNHIRHKTKKRIRPRAPLRTLGPILKALWSAKTYKQVFAPMIADIHYEWADARRRHETFRAWWILSIRGRYALLSAAWHQLPWSAWTSIKQLLNFLFKLFK